MSTAPNYRDFASDSGGLLGIHGHNETAGRYSALALVFSNGVLTARTDVDADEVIVSVDPEVPDGMPPVGRDVDDLSGLEGMVIEYVWIMTNHRGYRDAFQVRLLNLDSREEQCRQFEVAASALTVHRVTV